MRCSILPLVTVLTAGQGLARPVELDIPYVEGGGPKQQLDLYTPERNGFATIVYVHEGSLQTGDRKDEPYAAIALNFQAADIATALINYRLQSDAAWPAPAKDTAFAFKWVKQNIDRRGGAPDKVFLVGHSSGGHLVSLISTDRRYLEEVGLDLKAIAGTVVMGSLLEDPMRIGDQPVETVARAFNRDPALKYFGTPEAWVSAWPMPHIHGGMPPVLILIAESEQEQPPILADAEKFVAKSREIGATASFEVLRDRTHMSAMRGLAHPDDPAFRVIQRFLLSPGG